MNHIEFIEKHVRAELLKLGFTVSVAQGGGIPGCRLVPAHEPGQQERAVVRLACSEKVKTAVRRTQAVFDANQRSQFTGFSMSNTAKVIKFPAPGPAQQETRMADLENGYLRLANQIQDALCIVELSGREFRVLNAIVRLTYGWSKKSDRIANSLIADKTTLKAKHVSEAVLSLAYRNIIKLRRIGQTRYIGINTSLEQWAYAKPNCANCPVDFPVREIVTWVITIPEIGENHPLKQGLASPKTGMAIPENGDSKNQPSTIPENGDSYPRKQGKVSPKTGNTKDILPNTNINTKPNTPFNPPKGKVKFDPLSIPSPEWLDVSAWSEWVAYRHQSGKPIKTELTVTKAFKLLKDCLDAGHNPVDVINTSIANGYQGLFKPKYGLKSTNAGRDVNHISQPDKKIPYGFRGHDENDE